MNIIKKPSPDFTLGRKKYKPEAIVIHIMQGSLAGTDSWFDNRQSRVSAHYGVGKDGAIHQFVDEKDTAWHTGVVTNPSWRLIKKVNGSIYINPNYYTLGIEHEGTVDTEWTEAMYESTSTLIAEMSKRWNIPIDRNHIIGHHEIYAVKACPGHKVDFTKLINLALQKATPQKAQPIIKSVSPSATAVTKVALNVRHSPNKSQPPVKLIKAGTKLTYVGLTEQGEAINGNSIWYLNSEGYWFWSGGIK